MNAELRRTTLFVLPPLYGIAVLASVFAGGLVYVAIIGALLLSLFYTAIIRGGRGAGGRNRNRNRNRS